MVKSLISENKIKEIFIGEPLSITGRRQFSSDEKKNYKEYGHITNKIIHAIYGDNISFSNITSSNSVIIWYSDESKCLHEIIRQIKTVKQRKTNVYIIDSTNNSGSSHYENYFSIKNDSSIPIVLGFFYYYLTRKPLPEHFSSKCFKTNEAYRWLIEQYTLEKVSEWSGLDGRSLSILYKLLYEGTDLHHHLVFPDNHSEVNIQCIRSICLLSSFSPENEFIKTLPISYDGIDLMGAWHEQRYKGPNITDCYDSKSGYYGNKVNLYDWGFADRFDVDPFPLYKAN
ncbi:hypothetical protein [Litchfieldia alkalitelluris]|uniref:hypothetical protein n=1 Tax=Litchfieldia alkalitelluris TaxID=304268 RepID=UPI001593F151|nr:hypothetical protein [Litchfieldia alkalitelluris]